MTSVLANSGTLACKLTTGSHVSLKLDDVMGCIPAIYPHSASLSPLASTDDDEEHQGIIARIGSMSLTP